MPSGLFFVDGTYTDFLEARDEALRNQAAYQDTLAGLVRREVAWLRRGAKARTTKSKARIQSAEKSIDELAEARSRSAVATAGIEFTASGRKTKRLGAGEGLRAAYGATTIVAGLDLVLTPGMRLGVIGPNGSGKTTLLEDDRRRDRAGGGTDRAGRGAARGLFRSGARSLDPGLSLKRALAAGGDSVIYRTSRCTSPRGPSASCSASSSSRRRCRVSRAASAPALSWRG